MLRTIQKEIFQMEEERMKERNDIQKLRDTQESQPVSNYTFYTVNGETHLSELFGPHDSLLLVHNMGKSCPYCTMWADGFNTVYEKITERTAFVISSPDNPELQQFFTEERNWKTPMVSIFDDQFKRDFKDVITYGGISVFLKDSTGTIHLSTQTLFGPGDEYGILYNLLNLLPKEVFPHG